MGLRAEIVKEKVKDTKYKVKLKAGFGIDNQKNKIKFRYRYCSLNFFCLNLMFAILNHDRMGLLKL